jgi:hypothetical protein
MRKRIFRWLVGVTLALVVGLLGSRPVAPTLHSGSPPPTSIPFQTNQEPGGSGGGGG